MYGYPCTILPYKLSQLKYTLSAPTHFIQIDALKACNLYRLLYCTEYSTCSSSTVCVVVWYVPYVSPTCFAIITFYFFFLLANHWWIPIISYWPHYSLYCTLGNTWSTNIERSFLRFLPLTLESIVAPCLSLQWWERRELVPF